MARCSFLAANRRANRVSREFQDWQKAQAEPYPVIAWLAVRRVKNSTLADGRKIEDGYAMRVVVYNAGNVPLVVQIAKCMLLFGEAGYGDFKHFKGDPLVIPRTGLSTIRLACERHEQVPAEWPDRVSLILKYVGGRDVDGKYFEWNLLEVMGPDRKPDIRIADLDSSHSPPLSAVFRYFPDLRKHPGHRRFPVVVHRVRRYCFSVSLLFDLPSSRLSFANSIASSTHFVVSPRNLR